MQILKICESSPPVFFIFSVAVFQPHDCHLQLLVFISKNYIENLRELRPVFFIFRIAVFQPHILPWLALFS